MTVMAVNILMALATATTMSMTKLLGLERTAVMLATRSRI